MHNNVKTGRAGGGGGTTHGGGGGRNDFLGEMSESSLSLMQPVHVPHVPGPKSKMSQSQKSSAKTKKGTKKKSAVTN